jgi:hypothetical protein
VRGVVVAWLAALSIITYRSIRDDHMPPVPGRLLGASGLFGLLALLAEYPPAATTAVALAVGFDLAAAITPGAIPQGMGGTRGTATPPPAGSTAAGRGQH